MTSNTAVVARQPDMKTSAVTSTRTPVSIKIMSGHASADMKTIAIMMIDINREEYIL